jgi:MFS family permease
MAIGVALIAFTPPYAKIGIAAPIIAVLARAIQGFSAGGEFGSATAMLLECAAPKRRGLMASTQMASQGATVAIASILLLSLKHFLSPQAMQDWGWRSIFVVGMFIAPVGFYMRSRMAESPAFLAEISRAARAPGTKLWALLSVYGREVACMAGLVAIISSSFYLVMIILPVYAMRILHLAPGTVVTSTVICAAVQASMCLVGGRLSDQFGRRAVMLPACVLYAAATCALFLVLPGAAGFETLFGFQLAASICLGLLSGPFPAAISEILPVALRASGVGTVYMIVGAVFGGLSPVLIFLFIHASGDVSCPAYWALGTAAIGIISLLFLPRHGADGLAPSLPADRLAPTPL